MLHITTPFIGKSKNSWSKSSMNLFNRIDNMEQVFQGGARFCMGAMLIKMPIFRRDLDEEIDFLIFVTNKRLVLPVETSFFTPAHKNSKRFASYNPTLPKILLGLGLFLHLWNGCSR